MSRVHNFCAGPCTLPESVVAELAAELPDFEGSGMSLIEMSHRDPVYDRVHRETMELLRQLYQVPDDLSVLLLQGGASLQFAMVPLNLLAGDGVGGYVVSGSWGKKALVDAREVSGGAYPAWDGASEGFTRMPSADELELRDGSRFLHCTSNETIGGIRLPAFYDLGVRQVADMSSDFLTRPVPWERFDLVYGGAQKNLGPAGLTVVFVRNEVLERVPDGLPSYLRFETHTTSDSLSNTPPVFAVWAAGKMLRWIEANGGLAGMEQRAAERSAMVYDAIEAGRGFYRSPVAAGDRSHTNVVFRLADEALEARFLTEAEEADLVNLKGHRSVGGIRASIYNALPTASVQALVDFMGRFAAANG